jgi:DNA primase
LPFDQDKLNTLTKIVIENIESIYDHFQVSYYCGKKLLSSKCFIHGGDNKSALNLYHSGNYRIHYKCRTHCCEEHFGTSLLSMIRGALSHLRYNWTIAGDKEVSFTETINFLTEFLGIDFDNLENSKVSINSNGYNFCNALAEFNYEYPVGTITKEFYRNRVDIPAQYFIDRGFSKEILDKYDVGTCLQKHKPMSNRAIVPIYDINNDKIVGFSGRSLFPCCKKCESYHNPEYDCFYSPKWRHSAGFEKEKSLYNFGKAQRYIQKTNIAIIVESPGNVWRLESAGIHNSVAIFGTVLNIPQQNLLDKSGAMKLILIMDPDEAGKKAALQIQKQCFRLYSVEIVDLINEDLGEMSVDEVNRLVRPWL